MLSQPVPSAWTPRDPGASHGTSRTTSEKLSVKPLVGVDMPHLPTAHATSSPDWHFSWSSSQLEPHLCLRSYWAEAPRSMARASPGQVPTPQEP